MSSFHQLDVLDQRAVNQVCAGRNRCAPSLKGGGIGSYTRRPFEVLEANLRIEGNVRGAVLGCGVPLYFYASSAQVYPIEVQGTADAPSIPVDQVLPAHPELFMGGRN
jgi:hypothetical protein